jgi:hypothetical protein
VQTPRYHWVVVERDGAVVGVLILRLFREPKAGRIVPRVALHHMDEEAWTSG